MSDNTSTRVVFANDLPYTNGQDDPLQAIGDTLAFAVDDWSGSRAKAWIYGIVLGWDSDDDDTEEGAMGDLAERHGWSDEQVARLRALHERFKVLAESGA